MHGRVVAGIALAAAASLATAGSSQQAARPAVPIDAIGGIVDAFRTHALVGLGEGPHGNVEGHRFRRSLISDPRFTSTVNDIVVEFGNGRQQGVMDRFVRGESVDESALRHVWEDTTNVNPGWERPIYKEFFQTVRAVNASLPRDRQLRVLLGDPPIDWDTVHSRDDLRAARLAGRGFVLDLIRREVLAKNRRALLIFGDGHFQGRGEGLGLSGGFEGEGVSVWTISSGGGDLPAVQPDVANWPVPSLATLRGTMLGIKDYGFFYPIPPVREDFWRAMKLEGQFDAVLWLGPIRTFDEVPAALCADEAYMAKRLARMALGNGEESADRFRQECEARMKKQ